MTARRTREIGVRMALGARAAALVRGVMIESMLLTLVGIVVGSLAALAASQLIASMLFGASSADPATYVIAGSVMLLVALLAAGPPAWHACRIDPSNALRK